MNQGAEADDGVMAADFGAAMVNPGFEDISPADWYYDGVMEAYSNGYMPGGYDLAQFKPYESITRADVASGLFGCAGGYYSGDGTVQAPAYPFYDVSPNAWYAAAVDWCYGKGVIKDDSNGAFSPDQNITRQEVALWLMRYVEQRDGKVEVANPDVADQWNDAEFMTPETKRAAAWAVENGIMTLYDSNAFLPTESVTRAQLAVTLCQMQPQPIDMPSKIALQPLALGDWDDSRVALVIRVFGAQSVQWQVADADSDEWKNVSNATCAKLAVDRSTYESGLQKWRCEVTLADGRVEYSNATDGSIRYGELSLANYQWNLSDDGVLTIFAPEGKTGMLPYGEFSTMPWYDQADKVTHIVTKGDLRAPQSMDSMFSGKRYPNVQTIDLSHVDTTSCTSMGFLFAGCKNLTNITFGPGWNTANVRYMPGVFSGCSALASLDIPNWDVSQAELWDSFSMYTGMFQSCTALKKLNVSGWIFEDKADIRYLFSGCSALTDLNIEGWEQYKFSDTTALFKNCAKLTDPGVENWDTSKLEVAQAMFEGCTSLATLDLNKWDVSCLRSTTGMFRGCQSLTSVGLSSWNTPALSNSNSMFAGCRSLESIDLSNWDTSFEKANGREPLVRVFEDCYKLTSLTLGPNFQFASSPAGLFTVPKGMCWKATGANEEIGTTAELVDYHNRRTATEPETYVLAAKTIDPGQGGGSIGGGGGGGGSVEEPSIDVTDKTGGKVSIGDMGDASSSVTGVVSSVLAQDSTAYRQLTAKLAANESVLGAYRVDMKGSGKVAVTVSVGADFNGKTVKILQKGANGAVLESSVAVVGGSAVVLVDSSSDIVVAAAEGDKPADKPAFSDTPADAWYVADGSLAYVVEHGLMTGYSDSEFAPDDAFLRGQVVTVLWRIAGQPAASAEPFVDVDYDEYYGPAVAWARATGVVGGYGDTNTFGPDDKVTRAQLALMLSNYASVVAKQDVTSDGSALAGKADADQVPAWAAGALGWAADSGIVTGRETAEGAYIAPEDNALRCEAAKMIAVFHRDVLDLA